MSGLGKLSFAVWPVYIGAALEGTTPPFSINEPHNGGYERGTIVWYPADGTVYGRARIHCPPGTYTHFVYFHHPSRPKAIGVVKMDHPITFDSFTVLEVDPIINTDQQLARQL